MILPATSSSGGGIEPMLRAASASTGTSFEFLLDTARRESALDPSAQASTSSATGLFQFIESTWLDMIDQHGAEYGLGHFAEAITRGADGAATVSDPATRRAILDLRTDPGLSALMAGELAADNAAVLGASLGREPSAGELYIAHFLGASGAATLIAAASSAPDADATALFPRQAAANPGIFRTAGGQPRSLSEVYAALVGQHTAAPAVDVARAYAPEDVGEAVDPRYAGWTAGAPSGAFQGLFRTDASSAGAANALWSGFATTRGLFEVAVAEDALLPSGAALDLALDTDPVGPLPIGPLPTGWGATGSGPLDLTQFLDAAAQGRDRTG